MLKQAELTEFVSVISQWKLVDLVLVESFVLIYQAPEWKSFIRGHCVELTVAVLAEVFHLPNLGISLASVWVNGAVIVVECFPISYSRDALMKEELLLADVLPNWKGWIE